MKTYLTYGSAMAGGGFVLVMLLYIFGLHSDPEKLGTAMIVTFPVGLLITVIGIVLGTRAVRAPFGSEGFTYGQAWKAGFFVAVYAALFGVIFNFIYFKLVNPDFNEVSLAWTRSFMERMGMPDSQIDTKIEEMRVTNTAVRQIISGFIGAVCIGAIISLITAAVMKRDPSTEITDEPPRIN